MNLPFRVLGFSLATFIPLALYCLTAARFPQNYADSSELMTAAWVGGVAHPPSYPLYTFFLDQVMHLPLLQNPAWQANLTSAVFQALSLGLLYLVVVELLDLDLKQKSNWKTHFAALAGSLTLGFTAHFWFHALITEVFALNHVFTGWFFYFFLRWLRAKTFNVWFVLALIFLGLGASHHQTILLLVPGWLLLLIYRYEEFPTPLFSLFKIHFSKQYLSLNILWNQFTLKLLLALIIVGISFLSPFIIIFQQHQNQALFSWHFEPSLQGLWDLWARNLYAADGSAIETYTRQLNLWHSVQSLRIYVQFLADQFTGVGLVLIALGFWYGWTSIKKNPRFTSPYSFLLIAFVLTGPLLAAYLKFPLSDQTNDTSYFWGTALRLRMFLLNEYLLAVVLSLGIFTFLHACQHFLEKIKIGNWKLSHHKPHYYVLYSVICSGILILPSILAKTNYPMLNQTRNDFDQRFYRQILEPLPEKAILIGDSDHVFGLLYQQLVAGIRPDVILIPNVFEMRWFYFHKEQPNLTHFAYTKRRDQLMDLISWNLYQNQKVFILDPDLKLLEQLGVEANPYYATPTGYTLEISRFPQRILASDYSLSQERFDHPPNDWDYWARGLNGNLSVLHSTLGYYFAKTADQEGANRHFNLALRLGTLPQTRTYINELQSISLGSPNYYMSVVVPTASDFLQKAQEAYTQDQFDKAQAYLQKALYIDPLYLEARQMLIQVYQQRNEPRFVHLEQQNLNVMLQTILDLQ